MHCPVTKHCYGGCFIANPLQFNICVTFGSRATEYFWCAKTQCEETKDFKLYKDEWIKILMKTYQYRSNILFFRPNRKCFTHMETSTLPSKSCKCWPIFGTHGHWTVMVLKHDTSSVIRANRLWWSSSRTRDIHV